VTRRISAERKTAMVDILLKANADLNTQENSTGWTALMFAVRIKATRTLSRDWCLLELMLWS
jgi:ankyrin repeat protein